MLDSVTMKVKIKLLQKSILHEKERRGKDRKGNEMRREKE